MEKASCKASGKELKENVKRAQLSNPHLSRVLWCELLFFEWRELLLPLAHRTSPPPLCKPNCLCLLQTNSTPSLLGLLLLVIRTVQRLEERVVFYQSQQGLLELLLVQRLCGCPITTGAAAATATARS